MMGRRLVARKARPSLIISSPAARAVATARSIAAALSYPSEFLQLEDRAYLGEERDFSDLMLVGHNPGLTDLVNQLLPELELDNLPTGGAVAIEVDIDQWEHLREGKARLAYYDYPKNPEVLLIEA